MLLDVLGPIQIQALSLQEGRGSILQFTNVKDSRRMSPDCTSVALMVSSTRASSRWRAQGPRGPLNSSDHNDPRRCSKRGCHQSFQWSLICLGFAVLWPGAISLGLLVLAAPNFPKFVHVGTADLAFAWLFSRLLAFLTVPRLRWLLWFSPSWFSELSSCSSGLSRLSRSSTPFCPWF